MEYALNECFLCDFAAEEWSERYSSFCGKCPLYGKWDGEKTCTDKTSPYIKWHDADNMATCQDAARRIAALCRRELEKT